MSDTTWELLESKPVKTFTIYLAGSISGLSYDAVVGYFLETKKELEDAGYRVLHPMTGKAYLRNELEFRAEGYQNPVSTNRAICGRDHWMVQTSDIIYVNLLRCGERVSIGSMFEVAWAHEMGKHIIVAMQPDNIHRHAFLLDAADIVFETHAEVMEYLEKLAGGEM